MAAVLGQSIGVEVCKALGITSTETSRIRSIDIHIRADHVVTVTLERLVQEDEGKRLIPVLERYALVEKKEKAHAPSTT